MGSVWDECVGTTTGHAVAEGGRPIGALAPSHDHARQGAVATADRTDRLDGRRRDIPSGRAGCNDCPGCPEGDGHRLWALGDDVLGGVGGSGR